MAVFVKGGETTGRLVAIDCDCAGEQPATTAAAIKATTAWQTIFCTRFMQ